MTNFPKMTAEQFIAGRDDLPDGGRWHELHEGQPVLMEAPDDAHGTTVFNITKALSQWFASRTEQKTGYACHGIGLKVRTSPDTVLHPAISFFDTGGQFEETDNLLATQVPKLVVDIASANDRRSEMRTRTLGYAAIGIKTIWIPDPVKQEIQILHQSAHTQVLAKWHFVEGGTTLPGFRIKVEDVFAQPEWWK